MQKKILVVDDDPGMYKLYDKHLRRMLETVGVEVHVFTHPQDVLDAIERSGMPDVLLTDDLMPFMTGRDLASELRSRGYGGKILMVSGTADDDVLTHGIDERLQKPVSIATLSNSVRSLLG